MIAYISGKIVQKTDKSIIISAGGIGYQVFVSTDVLARSPGVGETMELSTYLAVRENALDLFGFETIDEKNFFELLLSVSGIGPRSALSILSIAPMETIKKAIGSGDTSYLTKVSGIGRKSAEKIIIELRDKLGTLTESDKGFSKADHDVIDALVDLDYNLSDIRNIFKEI